ncbi:MAG: TonB-dependent receptor [Pseudomonadota bacterium]
MDSKRLMTAAVFFWFFTNSTLSLADQTQADTTKQESKAFDAMFGKGPQEADVYRTDRLLLTATGSLKPVHLAPSVASVITADDIEKMGARTLDEALETVPGLHVSPSNKNQLDAIYSIRGIHTSLNPEVLVLINGLPVSYAYTGARPFSFQMPVSMISRIEVIRGPGSAVHGADAFAGTINIITKDSQEINGNRAGVRHGSFDSTDLWMQHGQTYNGWNLAMGVDYMRSDGDKKRIIDGDLQSTLDAGFGTSASLAPGALLTGYERVNGHVELAKDNWTLRAWGWLLEDDQMGDGVTNALAPGNNLGGKQGVVDLNHSNQTLLPDTTFTTRLNYSYLKVDTYFQLLPDGAIAPIGADGNMTFDPPSIVGLTLFPDGVIGHPTVIDKVLGLEETIYYEGFNQHKWRGALGFRQIQETSSESKNFGPGVLDGTQPVSTGALTDLTGTANIFMDDQTRRLGYVSLQDEWAFARHLELTAGVRYDKYSDFGSTLNPRAALVWEALPELTTKLMYGSAFRPPSFTELYAKNNPSNLGNPALKPETIDTYELAFDYQPTSRLRTVLSLFTYRIKDLVELVPNPGQPTSTAQNHKGQKGQGFELEADWEVLSSLRLQGNAAYQQSKDDTTGEVVPEAPTLQFYAGALWNFRPEWSLNGQYFWLGGRHRATGDTRPDIADYDLVNLTLRRKNIAKHWDAALAVRNIFNEDIREPGQAVTPNDYPMEGRAIWGEVSCHF